jgi:hypothetical protein
VAVKKPARSKTELEKKASPQVVPVPLAVSGHLWQDQIGLVIAFKAGYLVVGNPP